MGTRTIKHGVFTTKLAVFPLASPAYDIAGKHSQQWHSSFESLLSLLLVLVLVGVISFITWRITRRVQINDYEFENVVFVERIKTRMNLLGSLISRC